MGNCCNNRGPELEPFAHELKSAKVIANMKEQSIPTLEDQGNPQETSGTKAGAKKTIAFYTDAQDERTYMKSPENRGQSVQSSQEFQLPKFGADQESDKNEVKQQKPTNTQSVSESVFRAQVPASGNRVTGVAQKAQDAHSNIFDSNFTKGQSNEAFLNRFKELNHGYNQ